MLKAGSVARKGPTAEKQQKTQNSFVSRSTQTMSLDVSELIKINHNEILKVLETNTVRLLSQITKIRPESPEKRLSSLIDNVLKESEHFDIDDINRSGSLSLEKSVNKEVPAADLLNTLPKWPHTIRSPTCISDSSPTLPGGSPEARKLQPMPPMRSLSGSIINAPSSLVEKKNAQAITQLIAETTDIPRHKWMLKLCKEVFTTREMVTSNCTGSAGSMRLNEEKLEYMRQLIFNKYPCQGMENQDDIWKKLREKIDSKHRNQKKNKKLTFI